MTQYSRGSGLMGVVVVDEDGVPSQIAGQAPVAPGTATATKSQLIGGQVATTRPTGTNGQQLALTTDSRGNLAMTLFGADSGNGVSIANQGSADGAAGAATGIIVYSRTQGLNSAGSYDRARGDANGMSASPHAIAASRWNYAGVTGGLTDTSDTAVMAAGGASVRNYMTAIQYCNTSAVASEIVVKDGSTVIWRGMAPASMTSPVSVPFDVPLRGTANTALNVAMITTATATRVSAQGYQGV